MAGLRFPIKEGRPAPDSGLTSAISPVQTGGPIKRALERFFLQGLNFGFLSKHISGDAGLLLQEIFDISLDSPRLVLQPDGTAVDAFDRSGKPVHAYNTAGAVQHPGDAGTDRIFQAVFRPLRALRNAQDEIANPGADPSRRIIPPSAIAAGKAMDKLPAWLGVVVENFGMATTAKTRELRGLSEGVYGLLEGMDILMGMWPTLRRMGYKEYRDLKKASDFVERGLQNQSWQSAKKFLQKIALRFSEDIPAVTSAYRAIRKAGPLSTWERCAVRASAALLGVSAFEKVPGDLWPVRAAGSALISIGLLRRPNIKLFQPLAEFRGLVGVAQALYPIIEPHIHDAATKNLVAGALDEKLRIYTEEKDFKGSALEKLLISRYGENFTWDQVPDHLKPRWRVPDQFIHDGLISPLAALGATVCQFPDAWDKMVNLLGFVNKVPGVSQGLKSAFIDTFMVALQAAAGQRNPFQHNVCPGYDETSLDRLQLDPDGVTVNSVDGTQDVRSARAAPTRMYVLWAMAKWTYYRYGKGMDPTQIKILPPSHRKPSDQEIREMDVMDRLMADRHTPTLVDDAFRNINDYARWYQLALGLLANRLDGDFGRFVRALAEFPRNQNINLALT